MDVLIAPGQKTVEDLARMQPNANRPDDVFAYLTYSGADLSDGEGMQWEFMRSDELFKCIENMFHRRANIKNGTVETDKMVLKLMGLKRAGGKAFIQEMTDRQREQILKKLNGVENKEAFTGLMFKYPVALTPSKQMAGIVSMSRKEMELQDLMPDAFKHLIHMVNYDEGKTPTWKIMRTESIVVRFFLTGCRELAGNKNLSPEKNDDLILHMLKQRATDGAYFADRVAHTIPEVFKLLRTKTGKESLRKVPMKYHSMRGFGQSLQIARRVTAMEQRAAERQKTIGQ